MTAVGDILPSTEPVAELVMDCTALVRAMVEVDTQVRI